jgi:DNA-binding winged helix-turn-helix (wHTH) protein
MKPPYAFAFNSFVLDPLAGVLNGCAGEIALTPRAYALLEYLVGNAGRLLTKGELLDALWPRAYVTDGVLKVCVREIRRALNDDARAPRFIATAHRRGYRFIAPVEAAPLAARIGDSLVAEACATRLASPPFAPLTAFSLFANHSLMNRGVADG